MYHVIMLGELLLADFGEFWTRWTSDEGEARRFWDKEEGRVIAEDVHGWLSPRVSLS